MKSDSGTSGSDAPKGTARSGQPLVLPPENRQGVAGSNSKPGQDDSAKLKSEAADDPHQSNKPTKLDGDSTFSSNGTPDGAVASQDLLLGDGSSGDPAATLASQSGIGRAADAPFNGSFSQRVAIEVPGYHGLEPKLALAYDSNSGVRTGGYWAGFAGVGFRLAGLSDITRGSRVYGAPKFDASDVFSLDGDELVTCSAAIDSPACITGAAGAGITYYATRFESFLRIRRDTNTDSWQVTGRDGTVSTYAPVSAFGASDAAFPMLASDTRWLLQSVADTHGNSVAYTYQCDAAPVCWPQSIAYNGTIITFHRESVPTDAKLTLATGKTLATLDQRLTAIEIATSGDRIRASNLTYEQSPATGLSRLTSVQAFGKDATIDAGHVTGGTALPPTTFAYQGAALAWNALIAANAPASLNARDVNGDTKADLLISLGFSPPSGGGPNDIPGPNSATCTLSYYNPLSGGGSLSKSCEGGDYIGYNGGDTSVSNSNHQMGALDYNGDGRVDLVHSYYHTEWPINKGQIKKEYRTAILSNLGGSLSAEGIITTTFQAGSFLTIDLDGDGREDMLAGSKVLKASGAVNVTLPVAAGLQDATGGSLVMDANGDGRSDLVQVSNAANGQLQLTFGYSTGSNFTASQTLYFDGKMSPQVCGAPVIAWPNQSVPSDTRAVPADVNGDGKLDIVYLEEASAATAHLSVLLSTGSGFVKQVWASDLPIVKLPTNTNQNSPYVGRCPPPLVVTDLDGDGRTDVIVNNTTTSSLRFLSKGGAFAAIPGQYPMAFVAADFNGDGLDEVFAGSIQGQTCSLRAKAICSTPRPSPTS